MSPGERFPSLAPSLSAFHFISPMDCFVRHKHASPCNDSKHLLMRFPQLSQFNNDPCIALRPATAPAALAYQTVPPSFASETDVVRTLFSLYSSGRSLLRGAPGQRQSRQCQAAGRGAHRQRQSGTQNLRVPVVAAGVTCLWDHGGSLAWVPPGCRRCAAATEPSDRTPTAHHAIS